MAKASDNVFPKLILSEQTTPAAPSAGQQKLFVDSADHKVKRINSSGTVTTVEGGGSGGGSTYPPGSADIHPTTPNAKDDEFDGTSTVTWSATPTAANAFDINTTRADHAYIKASGSGSAYVGKVQPVPGSFPFTITAKVKSSTGRANNHRLGGIVLGPASPTGTSTMIYLGQTWDTTNHGAPGTGVNRMQVQFGGTFGTVAAARPLIGHHSELYLRMTVTSATSISTWTSTDGYAWTPVESAFSPSPAFTPGVMGIVCSEEGSAVGVESYFEWFRVT